MPKAPTPRELGHYFALAQVGMEMVVPVAIGLALDHYLGWTPWGVVGGAVLGLAVGLVHMVALLNRQEGETGRQPPEREEP
jgi:F0F1-type ATP synthase assembly protein I